VNTSKGTTLATRALVANTIQERTTGLLNRSSLENGEGLIIPGCKRIHSIGMKFPIEVIFLSDDGQVVRCGVLTPGGFAGAAQSDVVIELPIGTIGKTGTLPGDYLETERVQ
jgi:hypothetical protein